MTDRSSLSREQLLALVEELERQQVLELSDSRLLRIRDGDILAVEIPGRISMEAADRFRELWDERIGQWLSSRGIDARFVVLADGAKLRVIRHGEE